MRAKNVNFLCFAVKTSQSRLFLSILATFATHFRYQKKKKKKVCPPPPPPQKKLLHLPPPPAGGLGTGLHRVVEIQNINGVHTQSNYC